MINSFDPNIKISLTKNAIDKINSLVGENEFVRLYIMGGGCSGFQYMFDIVSEMVDDDIEISGSKMIIDTLSYQYLENSTIDYENDIMGAKFVVKNPLAKTTCGCGQSFSL